jgi:hypothetical protein
MSQNPNSQKSKLSLKIQKNPKKIKFDGLGNMDTFEIPEGAIVMVKNSDHSSTNTQSQKILTIPGVSGSKDTASSTDSTEFMVEVANFDGEMVSVNNHLLGVSRTSSSKAWSSQISPELIKVFYKRMGQILKQEGYLFN